MHSGQIDLLRTVAMWIQSACVTAQGVSVLAARRPCLLVSLLTSKLAMTKVSMVIFILKLGQFQRCSSQKAAGQPRSSGSVRGGGNLHVLAQNNVRLTAARLGRAKRPPSTLLDNLTDDAIA